MPRTPRLQRLEPDEYQHVHSELRAIREKINKIYAKVDQRFGISNKKALRLQALKRKLTEVENLFSDI